MVVNKDLKIGGILLAAGGSARLGRPKQLLNFKGKTLIRRAAETLVDSQCDPIVVVLGAEIKHSTAELSDLDVHIFVNETWQDGMSTSIVCGLHALLDAAPDLEAIVITLCDQPHVNSADIDALINAFHNTGNTIVAAQYGETIGVPALFSKPIFEDLRQLKGDKGARNIIHENRETVETVVSEKAVIDIDTLDDFDRLNSE